MHFTWHILSNIFIMALILHTGTEGYSCYSCKNGEPCDDVTEQMKTDCTSALGAINTCIKAKVSGNTIRACGVPGTNINKCEYDSGVSVCMCTSDLCNGAQSQRPLPVASSLTASFVIFFLRSLMF